MYVHPGITPQDSYTNSPQGQLMIYFYGTRKYLFHTRHLRRVTGVHLRAETFLIILCGCLPTLRPLYLQIFGHRAKSTSDQPSFELRISNQEKKNSDASPLVSDGCHDRNDSLSPPSIDANIINAGQSFEIDAWAESDRNTVIPLEHPRQAHLDGSNRGPTSRATLEV